MYMTRVSSRRAWIESQIPEPCTLVLTAGGAGLLMLRRRRRR
jgi:hypothetical protein